MHGLDSLPRALRACWCAGLESDVMHIDIDTGHMDTETDQRHIDMICKRVLMSLMKVVIQ